MNTNLTNTPKEQSLLIRFLKVVESAGNKLPHPVILFVYAILLVIGISFLFELLGISVNDPRPLGTPGRSADGLIFSKSLLNADGIRYILTTLISNFVLFAPFGTVLVSFIGIGIAEKSGIMETSLKSLVKVAPKKLISVIVIFAGVMSNIATDIGYIVLIPLGAMVFYGFGRHPIAGLGAAFVGVSGGYSANLLLGTIDPLLAGITQESAKFLVPTYQVGAEANWYFMCASVFLVTAVGTLVTERIIEPMLGSYKPLDDLDVKQVFEEISPNEKKALRLAGIFSLSFFVILFLLVYPGKGILLNQKTLTLTSSPFFQSIVAFIFLFFVGNGIIFGFVTKKFKNMKDIVDAMQSSIVTLSSYVILAFFMAQFINYFSYTKLGIILSVSLAELVLSIGMSSSLFLVALVFIIGFINLFMGSASAKWALLAPIFIPMFMLIGISPELTQLAYRIGDSSTNIISPLLSYLPLILFAGNKYVKNFGLGNLMSVMLPYSIALLVLWSVFLYVWVFVFNLPIGPSTTTYFDINLIKTDAQ